MSFYWARFETHEGNLFRFDTRIYLQPIAHPLPSDPCLGAVIGKNPGSALPAQSALPQMNQPIISSLQAIELNGDRCLPTIRSIVNKAYGLAQQAPPQKAYIQVLNLFYLCNPNLRAAVKVISQYPDVLLCGSELKQFSWAWYVWGGDRPSLNPFKKRFATIQANQQFFYNHRTQTVEYAAPTPQQFAKHTQGIKHGAIVPTIAALITD